MLTRQSRKLFTLLVTAAVVCGCAALIVNGPGQITLAAVGLVLLLVAVFCAIAVGTDVRTVQDLDSNAPTSVTLPPSPVTQLYDPSQRSNPTVRYTQDNDSAKQ